MTERLKVVGHSVEKVDAMALATGAPLFVADELPADTLIAAALRSPHAHADIVRIDAGKARALPGVHAVLTHQDVPRIPYTTAGQGAPEPSPYDTFILDKKVRFVGDVVALVAAETRAIAAQALKLIEVEYRVLPAVLDMRQALAPGAPVIHDEPEACIPIPVEYEPGRNLCSHVDVHSGDVDAELAAADHRIDAEYEVHYAQHAPLETHICAAWLDGYGRLIVRTSTQVTFHVRRIVARALNLDVKQVRVIKPRVGGAFGAKQEVLLEPMAAALALAARRPVLFELSRYEETVCSRTRHPQAVRLEQGFMRDGALRATRMTVLSNTGAYGSHGLTVMMNCGSKTLPLYRRPAVAFRGTTVYTNLPVAGAYRGYGGTQASFAQEVQMDEIAKKLGLDPIALRLKNILKKGEGSPAFAMLGEGKAGVEQVIRSTGLEKCLKLGMKAIGWKKLRGRPGKGPFKRGVGVAALMQGSSIPEVDMAAVTIKMNEDGSFNLLAGATDLGTGSDTVLAQIAAEVLGTGADKFVVLSSDTDVTPFDVGAYASSTTYLSGMAAKRAAEKVAQQIKQVAAEVLGCKPREIRLADGRCVGPGDKSVTHAAIGGRTLYESDQFQIAATESAISHSSPPPFAAHFAQVEVDTETGLVRVLKYVVACDCGRAIHPKLAEGQIEGSVANGIGYALCERFCFDDHGKVHNGGLGDYRIFSAVDMPELVVILVPTVEPTGPYGAKSVSEININGACPAISNAIFDACGIRLRKTPFTPDAVLAALDAMR
ncbi:MAG: molybdopterin-dependent oxidoreductase [Deltaproteobacteria bacterium]|nr:molybdopterin-dependent oxidoreductase [Deltaproteobacteria bacterium]